MMRETTIEQHVVCICGHNCERHLSGYTCQEKCDCLEYRAVTDNRAEGEQEHSPLPWRWMPDKGQFIVSAKGDIVAEIPCQGCNPLDGQLIVRACNEHYERGERIAHLESQLNTDSDYEALQRDEIEAHKQRIEQLEQVIRDQMSVLRDWRGADNVPQQVRDAMAIRLTELRWVVEGK